MQILLMVFWYHQKQNYFLDELYSFQYAHFWTDSEVHSVYLDKLDGWEEGAWRKVSECQDTFIVTPERSVFSVGIVENLRLLLKKRNYFGLLNLYESVFQMGRFSGCGGFLLNLTLFIPVQLLIYNLIRKVIQNRLAGGNNEVRQSAGAYAGVFGILISGCCPFMINLVIYIRFYLLALLFVLIFLNLQLYLWEQQEVRVKKQLLLELPSFAALYFAFQNSELICIFGGLWILIFAVSLGCRKRWKQLALYLLPVVLVMIPYFVIKVSLFDIIMNPSKYLGTSYAKNLVTSGFLHSTPGLILKRLWRLISNILKLFFGSKKLGYAIVAGIIIAESAEKLLRRRGLKGSAAGRICGSDSKESTGERISDCGFLVTAGCTSAFYLVLMAWLKCTAFRYSTWVVPILITFLILIGWDLIHKYAGVWKRWMRILGLICMVGVLLFPVMKPEIVEYAYTSETKAVQRLDRYSRWNVVVDATNQHTLYEAIANTDRTRRFLALDPTETVTQELPKKFLLYVSKKNAGKRKLAIRRDLIRSGYRIRKIAVLHGAVIYRCRKT